mmetsp:Transcript_34602/g.57975  ORF Transcript_34602/g.57975 Transcript_34602/m.57975 type:complete len:250 (-) Transcript_34602:3374-4123(-)
MSFVRGQGNMRQGHLRRSGTGVLSFPSLYKITALTPFHTAISVSGPLHLFCHALTLFRDHHQAVGKARLLKSAINLGCDVHLVRYTRVLHLFGTSNRLSPQIPEPFLAANNARHSLSNCNPYSHVQMRSVRGNKRCTCHAKAQSEVRHVLHFLWAEPLQSNYRNIRVTNGLYFLCAICVYQLVNGRHQLVQHLYHHLGLYTGRPLCESHYISDQHCHTVIEAHGRQGHVFNSLIVGQDLNDRGRHTAPQ